ncbi:ABC transporter permease subunit [Shinella sp. AETb1-6]|uniref:carbohydrate ABC transporter permease n=1 Tax=Shinella sp. AETb1-6 TaxID=2692210 RepID=UPI001367C899|nr:sugar ABC transporter permease [Shinella sp. AETb1-6]MXN53698.1 ABC transporter permease subunit [Shinella sp. AETb1-6]
MNRSITAPAPALSKAGRKVKFSYKTLRKLVPYLYVTPATLLLVLLMLFPMAMVLRYSLMDGAIMKRDAAFVGLQNYITIFQNPVFWQSLYQTLYFTVMSVVFHFVLGLAFAMLLNTNRVDPTIRSILRVLFILPWLFTAVIIAIIWRLLLDPNGVVNSVLMALHIIDFKVEWFSSTNTAIHALTFANIWAGYPLFMVSLLAGLQGISKELYEAAGIDGANEFQKFWHITIPQLMPIIISIALLDFIWTMQVFPLVWMTTGGGPIYATEMLSTFTYKLAFAQYEFSLASASAIVILLISMSVTYFYIKHQQRR